MLPRLSKLWSSTAEMSLSMRRSLVSPGPGWASQAGDTVCRWLWARESTERLRTNHRALLG